MNKRLFIAINLPPEIKKQIQRIIEQINIADNENFRWMPPENWHLTLVFLGDQPDEAISEILSATKTIAEQHSNILENVRMLFYGCFDGG